MASSAASHRSRRAQIVLMHDRAREQPVAIGERRHQALVLLHRLDPSRLGSQAPRSARAPRAAYQRSVDRLQGGVLRRRDDGEMDLLVEPEIRLPLARRVMTRHALVHALQLLELPLRDALCRQFRSVTLDARDRLEKLPHLRRRKSRPTLWRSKHKLLGHLGLERAGRAGRPPGAERERGVTALARRRDLAVSVAVFLALIVLWEILSLVYTAEAQPGEPMVAGWGTLFTRTLLSLSDYWQGGFGVKSVADGAQRSYLAAILSLASHSAATFVRLISGLLLGGVLGVALGLGVSWSRWSRRLVELPTQFLRALPLLAMVPLFQLWFGTYFFGQVLFVAYGVGVIVFAGVVNAGLAARRC